MIKTVSNKENYVTEQQSLKYLLSGPLMSKFSAPPWSSILDKNADSSVSPLIYWIWIVGQW